MSNSSQFKLWLILNVYPSNVLLNKILPALLQTSHGCLPQFDKLQWINGCNLG